MNRNANSHFAYNPTNIDMPRSRFDMPSEIKLTGKIGEIIPFYCTEVLPGDTFNVKTSKTVRLQTLVAPIFDNIVLDTYYFYCPNRLVWSHWVNFMGENTESAWVPETEYEVPVINAPANGWDVGTIADYLGIPTGVENISPIALPFRAYAKICDDWFRSEVLSDPLAIPMDETTVTGVNTGDFVTDVAKGGKPYTAAKFFDYFTGATPSPQRGEDISIQAVGGTYPVVGNGYALPLWQGTTATQSGQTVNKIGYLAGYNEYTRVFASNANNTWSPFGLEVGSTVGTGNSLQESKAIGVPTAEQLGNPAYSGLVTILGETSVATVNQLRLAFQIQKLYEKDARSGGRYISVLKGHFGVTSPDARLQRTEYLGGNRIPININQVVQTSGTQSGSTPLADTGAYSLTNDVHDSFVHSFVEHGYVIGVMVLRYNHTYQQGLERFWSRRSRFDYYWPVLANIGEQAILNKEIYAQGTAEDDEVFGYQEAWADYRYKPSRIAGQFRSSYPESLDVWHLGDDYDALPTLSDSWIREDKSNLDRALVVSSDLSDQFFADIYVENRATRCMPLYSIPGLIDHH